MPETPVLVRPPGPSRIGTPTKTRVYRAPAAPGATAPSTRRRRRHRGAGVDLAGLALAPSLRLDLERDPRAHPLDERLVLAPDALELELELGDRAAALVDHAQAARSARAVREHRGHLDLVHALREAHLAVERAVDPGGDGARP